MFPRRLHTRDFGFPRRCWSFRALDAEVARQERLARFGYARRFGASSYWWTRVEVGDGRLMWKWWRMDGGSHGGGEPARCPWPKRGDAAKAWSHFIANRDRWAA